MRPVLVDDRWLAVAIGEDLEHMSDVGAGAARGEFAIAESAGASLTEQVIAFGVELAREIEAADVGDPVLDGPAAFEDERPIARSRQQITGEEPGRARAHDNRPVLERARAWLGPFELLGNISLESGRCAEPCQLGLVKVGEGGVVEVDIIVGPRVDAFAKDSPVPYRRARNSQPRGDLVRQAFLGFFKLKADVREFDRHRVFQRGSGPKQTSVMSST